ncbi:MAG: ABC transporter permease, partial [Alphaproteobacteria bacterium]|nr:ABC transporter permease [Alphaproteobacteria bacterium]
MFSRILATHFPELAPSLTRLFARRLVLAAALILAVFGVAAIVFPLVSGFDPSAIAVSQRLQSPTLRHLAGTDELGRDLMGRIVYGAHYSLLIGLLTATGAVFLGLTLGLLAGYFRRLESPLMRLVDALMAFPDILLGIALVAILGVSLWNVMLALIIVYTPRVARVVRSATLVIREFLFIDAARAMGVSTLRILLRHMIPNLLSPLLVQFSFIFAYAILAEAGLSFLGVGVPATVPT